MTNRRLYTQKFSDAMQILSDTIPIQLPDAGFYFWLETPISDTEFTKLLYRDYNVTVLPGSYLGREAHGINPGVNHVRIALVATLAECTEAMQRIKKCISHLK